MVCPGSDAFEVLVAPEFWLQPNNLLFIKTAWSGHVVCDGFFSLFCCEFAYLLKVDDLEKPAVWLDDGTPNGVVSLALDSGDDVARGVAIDPRGRIVVVGDSVGKDGTTDVVVARLKPDGDADQEFAVAEDGLPKGVSRTSLGSGNDNATDVVLDSQGHIIVAGYHQEGGRTRVSILRFTDDGKLDESFGAAQEKTPKGTVSLAIGQGNALGNGITTQGDKLILVGGATTDANGNSNIALMRLLAN